MALPPLILPEALILPGVAMLPLTLASLKMLPLRLSWAALMVALVVILPPAPAPLVNERSNPVPSVTLPPVLIAPLVIFPLRDKLLPLTLPVNMALAPFTLPDALMLPGVAILPFTLALLKMFPLRLS